MSKSKRATPFTPEERASILSEFFAPRPKMGRIYVLEFSTGIVKVGRTVRPGRIEQHAKEARRYGVSVVRHWISAAVDRYTDIERTVIRACAREGVAEHGVEYFRMPYERALAIVQEACA